MKSFPAKTAFLHKNFREMGLEMKTVFLAHLLTVVFCFMPWVGYTPLYGSGYLENAFSGATKFIGIFIFLISLAICSIFFAKLFKIKIKKLPVEEDLIFIFAGFQQIILIICAWSVLFFMGNGYDSLEIRFGIIFCLLFQVFALVGAFLLKRGTKKEEVIGFFHQTEERISSNAKTLFSNEKKGNSSDSMKSREKRAKN